MISLITIGPTLAYEFGCPGPVRNSSTVAGLLGPKVRKAIAGNSGPTLVTKRPNDTPFSAAPKLTNVRNPVRLPALSAVESQISSPRAELRVKGVPGLLALNWFS